MKACEWRNEAQLVNFMQKMDNTFVLLSFFGKKQLNVHIFLLRSKCFPGASYHYIQICRVEALGSLPTLNLLDKFVFCALFVCACIWFIPSARVFVKSFQCLCCTETMFVVGISAVLIAGDANSDAFKASSLFFSLLPL